MSLIDTTSDDLTQVNSLIKDFSEKVKVDSDSVPSDLTHPTSLSKDPSDKAKVDSDESQTDHSQEPETVLLLKKLSENVESVLRQAGIVKLIGCFKMLLDRRLIKITRREKSESELQTRIAFELIPVFQRYSERYLEGKVSLALSANGAWVRGLMCDEVEGKVVEEIKGEALVQGICLKMVGNGYLKVMFTNGMSYN